MLEIVLINRLGRQTTHHLARLIAQLRLNAKTLDQKNCCSERHAYEQSDSLSLEHGSQPRITVVNPGPKIDVRKIFVAKASEKHCYGYELNEDDGIEDVDEAVTIRLHTDGLQDYGVRLSLTARNLRL